MLTLDERGELDPRERLVDRRPSAMELGVGLAAAALAAAATAIVVSGGVVDDTTDFSVLLVSNILGLAAAGLLWLRVRPWSPVGKLLLALALVTALTSLAAAPNPGLYAVGILAGWAVAIGATWLMTTFPGGRLDAGARVIVGYTVGVFVLVFVPQVLVSQSVTAVGAVGRCSADCPANALLLTDRPGLAHGLDITVGAARVVWAAALVAYLVIRFARASRPRRRLVLPVYAASLVFAVAFGLNALVLDALQEKPATGQWIHGAVAATRVLFPLAFIAAILLAQAYAGTALALIARELAGGSSVAAVEALVRRALDDASARLAFWLPRLERYADRHGRTVELDPASEWRTWRSFGRGRASLLAVEHDPALRDDPELLQAVGSAALMAFENRRLEQDLLDSIAALRASQRRLFMAAAAERRKIERNLHDSTQQKLVAIRIQLELAREQAAGQGLLRNRLAALGNDLDDALDELRAVAHGIYPPLLADEGLPAALREAALRAGVPVELELQEVGRLPEELEAAVYYCCLEGLQNAVKHAGSEATLSLTLFRQKRTVHFSVADDGVGFTPGAHGFGLTSMSDRLAAVGGAVTIHSAEGAGTTVEGRIPIPVEALEAERVPGV